MATVAVFTNIAIQQKTAPYACNMAYGFDLWKRNSDGVIFRYPLRTDGVSLRGSDYVWSGYTWISKQLGSTTFHNGAETDYNVDGTLINMDAIDQDPEFGNTIFANVTKVNDVITKVGKELAVYSAAPTGACFNKTVRWAKMLPYALQDVNNEYILDENGEYQITAE